MNVCNINISKSHSLLHAINCNILDDLIDVFIIYYTGGDYSGSSIIRFPTKNTYRIRVYARPDGILENHEKLRVTAYLPSHNGYSDHNCSADIEIQDDSKLHKISYLSTFVVHPVIH